MRLELTVNLTIKSEKTLPEIRAVILRRFQNAVDNGLLELGKDIEIVEWESWVAPQHY
jgi:hypothetical protein